VRPPSPTILDEATEAARDVITVGKVGDIFTHSGTGRVLKASGNDGLFDNTMSGIAALQDGGLLFANFIDFDTVYGHRRDIVGYATALERFDARVLELTSVLCAGDLAVITADHGCDPTWSGSDHTREQVPILAFGPGVTPKSIGRRSTFADVAATVAAHLALPEMPAGTRF